MLVGTFQRLTCLQNGIVSPPISYLSPREILFQVRLLTCPKYLEPPLLCTDCPQTL